MNRDQLKELIRTEPTIASTLEAIEADYSATMRHAEAVGKRRAELLTRVGEINKAKLDLIRNDSALDVTKSAEPNPQKVDTGEPSQVVTTDKPKHERKKT